jgi:leader peptidase (prepilin peptidase) / N-methyltransferase
MEYNTDFISSNYFVVTLFLFIVGACVGSFMNVCIHRLPQEGMSIVKPASHCPSCRVPLRWYDNIPLVSYVLLRGKCRSCQSPISVRYVIVEALTAFLFVEFFILFGCTPRYFLYVYLVCSLIVATFIDFKHQIIPDEINLAGGIVALVVSFFFPEVQGVSTKLAGLGFSFLGLLVGGVSMYATGMLGALIFRKESMGGGDVKFMAMLGAVLGWKLVLLTYFIAPFFGSVVGLYAKYIQKQDIIPYGPFLSCGAVISLLWGSQIIAFFVGK